MLRLVEGADALLEGFRPGVAERLGIGPEPCLERNPRLVYGRMTGWGQEGPLADTAGHDLTYAAVAGALAHIGRAGQPPTPPLNLVADFGGGGMLLALGLVAGLLHARTTGEGQVVDAAMVDGTALLMAPFYGASAMGFWSDERGTNLLDSGAPYYDVYRCADGLELGVAAIEPQFFAALLEVLELDPSDAARPERSRPLARAAAVDRGRGRRRVPGPSGWRVPRAPMPASRPCSRCARPPSTRTSARAARSSSATACPSPRRRRGSRPRPASLDRPPCVPGQHTDEVLVEARLRRRRDQRPARAPARSPDAAVVRTVRRACRG